MKGRAILISLILGIVLSVILTILDFYLRDRVFGVNIFMFPIAILGLVVIDLILINRINGYYPNFFKSLLYALITVVIGASLFSLYCIRELNFSLLKWVQSTIDIFAEGSILSGIAAFLYRKK